MKKIVVCLLLLFAADSGFGRKIPFGSYRDMYEQADLVVIAKPLATRDTSEVGKVPRLSTCDVVGLSTDFEALVVMKGNSALNTFVLHHYREEGGRAPNGPCFVSFTYDPTDPMHSGGRYLLFLKKEADGRYAPVAGQMDPALFSVLKLPGLAR